MRRLAGALLLIALAATAAVSGELRITKHARQRMSERGVTQAQVERIVETIPPFFYYHEGRKKSGYYDPKTRVFLAADGDVVITVIANATPRYVEKLKRKKP